jgi:hypothetical protein
VFLAVFAALLSSILIPQFTREWADRQKEHEIKQSLIEEISTASTTAVRQAISLEQATGGKQGESQPNTYADLRNSWLIRRANARSRIITYLPGLYGCWYSYERALADYISLIDPSVNPSGRKGRASSLEAYVDRDFNYSYVYPQQPAGCGTLTDLPLVVQMRHTKLKQTLKKATHWDELESSTDTFNDAYMALGEDLNIGMERIIITISHKPADGFSHGVHLFGIHLS